MSPKDSRPFEHSGSETPGWEIVGNLGDVNLLEYGGFVVYRDKKNIYQPEAEAIFPKEERENEWDIYRFTLEKCTYQGGILSDNPFHPSLAAWWAKPYKKGDFNCSTLEALESYTGTRTTDLIRMACSDDPMERAVVYKAVGDCHGYMNLDQYPLDYLTRKEMKRRYARVN